MLAGDQFTQCQKVISQAQLSRKLVKCVPWQAEGKKKINQVFQRNSQNFPHKIPFWLKEDTKIETLTKKKRGLLSVIQLQADLFRQVPPSRSVGKG